MASTEFINALRTADSEKLVESAYHNQLRKSINEIGGRVQDLKTLHGTDGVLDGEIEFDGSPRIFRIIIETKMNETFNVASVRAKVLSQVVYYLKKFDDLGEQLPNIILVGDVNECFVVHSNYLAKYLDKDYDWNIAPSQVYRKNIELVKELTEDTDLQRECFVYEINDNFEFSEVVDRIASLIKGVKTQVRITDRSISKVFDYFTLRVLKRSASGEAKYSAREQVEYFMQLVLNEKDCYLHPKKKNKAVLKDIEVEVNADAFESFIHYYQFNYNILEKKQFTAIADRLIEDSDRRRKGDFYTPAIWVDEAHKLVSEKLGPKWKEEYIVWDCASGTHNLTRDYRFFELYASTLEEHDLVIGAKYNPEAEAKFQYDFLNDDVERFDELLQKVSQGYALTEKDFYGTELWKKAPSLIRGLLNGKKLLFFINPPYGTGGDKRTLGGAEASDTKKGITSNAINRKMVGLQLGNASKQLYSNFLFRCKLFQNLFGNSVQIGLFSPILFVTSVGYKPFRDVFYDTFTYSSGFLLQASNFADVSSNWGISFTLWESEVNEVTPETVPISVKELSEDGVVTSYIKTLYSLLKETACNNWIKTDKREVKTLPMFTSAIKVAKGGKQVYSEEGSLGYYSNKGNIVDYNSMEVYLMTAPSSRGAGLNIHQDNFSRVIANFSARRLITGKYASWDNSKDEYMIPKVKHPLYSQWESDALVYSLFNTASNQSSLRQVYHNGKQWNILNHFFFMSKKEMEDLALGEHHNDEVYEDLQHHAEDERFVYRKLQEVTLSPDAQAVLDKARQLVRDSFQYRDLFNQEHPEYYINTFDAGWYQIKGLLKEYMPEELKEFNKLYKQFEDRMRPLVVELGFLYDYPGYEEERKKYLGDDIYEVPEEEEILTPNQTETDIVSPSEPKPITTSMFNAMMSNFNKG